MTEEPYSLEKYLLLFFEFFHNDKVLVRKNNIIYISHWKLLLNSVFRETGFQSMVFQRKIAKLIYSSVALTIVG